MSNSLQEYIKYWQEVFSSDSPIKELGLNDFKKEMKLFELDVPPEPYYGYFHEDMTNDILLLLFNPGAKEKRTDEEGWNESIKERYTEPWTKKIYDEEELRIKKESNWRHTYLESARNLVGEAGFLHTMEFFPFHSRKDLTSKKFKDRWMSHESSTLAFQALKDIAINHKVKQILTVNEIWPSILEKHNVPLTHHVELFRRGGKAYSFRFKVYQFDQNALPILLCKANGNMKLPKDKFAIEVARRLLGLSNHSIPINTEFDIKVY